MSGLFSFPSTSLLLLVFSALFLPSVAGDDAQAQTAKSSAPGAQSPLVADKQTMVLFEMAIASLVAAFFFVFMFGAWTNNKLARRIAKNLSDIVSLQFARIGTDSGKVLIKDGQSYFWFYASGRRYTSGLTVFMDLAKRMDIFSYTSSFLTSPQKDRCIFYLPLTNDFDMDPMSLFLVRKKELARLKDVNEGVALEAVEALGAQVLEANGIPSDFVIMTEHSDIVHALLPDNIRAKVRDNTRHLISIHVTENGAKWEPQCRVSKRLVRVEFTLPMRQSQIPDVLEAMAAISLHLVDAAAESKITPAARKKAVELRKKAVLDADRRLQKKRAEEAANRRLEKKKEEEEAVGKMSREKQLKHEEKKRKKELTARMRKATRK